MSNTTTRDRETNTPAPPAPLTPEEITSWLDYMLDMLVSRRDADVIPMLADMAKKHPTIAVDDEDTAGNFAENARIAKKLIATAEARRVDHKAPFLDGGRAVDSWFRRFGAPVIAALAPVERIMLDHGERRDAAAKKAAQAEAERRMEQAQRAAEVAAMALERNAAPQVIDAALADAAQTAGAADVAEGKQHERGHARGIYGAVSSVRTTWSWELVDLSLVPREYLTVSDGAIREAAKRRDAKTGRPLATIPGIKWVEQKKIGVR